MDHLLVEAAASLRKAAMNEQAKKYVLNDQVLFNLLKRAANRYIGGETLEEAIEKVMVQNAHGYRCAIEFMGENTTTTAEATLATEEFLRASVKIHSGSLNAALALDLSHIGLSISPEFCLENLLNICEQAAAQNIEVTISAEAADKTDAVLQAYRAAAKQFGNVSITLQAYLHRTAEDLAAVMEYNGRVRLVKGAFETPPGISLPRGAALNKRYLDFLDLLLSGSHKCSIATHDTLIQSAAEDLIRHHQPDRSNYEFESLYGIQAGLLAGLKERGHPAKVYFVYGREWYLYLCNRIAEHPLNLFTALKDIVEPG